MPSRLWSTVITQSWSVSTHGRSTTCAVGMAIVSDDIAVSQILDYRSVSRYRTSASRSASLNFMGGISDPGLMASGFSIHRRRFSVVFAAAPDAMVSTAHQVRQIRTEASGGGRSADRMAVHARGRFENAPARA